MSERLTPEARGAAVIAYGIAKMSASQNIETEHLLIGIMRENPGFLNRFMKTEVTGDPFLEAIRQNFARGEEIPKSAARPERTEEYERVIAMAAEEAERAGQENIGIDNLLIAILREKNSTAARMLRERGADLDLIRFQLTAVPYEPPLEKEHKLRALNRMVNLLDTSHPSESAKIAEIRNRLECSDGEDASDLGDQIMEMMADKAAPGARLGRDPGNGGGWSNRTSEKMRRLIFFAQFEAKRSGSPEVETGHLLLVILREQKKHWSLFMPLAISKEAVSTEIEETLRTGEIVLPLEVSSTAMRPPLSEECKRAQTHAREEADMLWSSRAGPEHLLLGLLREESSFAARIMRKYGAEPEKIREGLAALPHPGSANSNERPQ
jgi:ATP-dependent Clp protease ATP-binding subunit ClpA